MGDKVTSARYRLMPLDNSGLVYLGIDVTDGKQAALLVIVADHIITASVDPDDFLFRDILAVLTLHQSEFVENHKPTFIEIDGKDYTAIPWSNNLDRSLVGMIDRLINLRMKNSSVVSMAFQLELPLR